MLADASVRCGPTTACRCTSSPRRTRPTAPTKGVAARIPPQSRPPSTSARRRVRFHVFCTEETGPHGEAATAGFVDAAEGELARAEATADPEPWRRLAAPAAPARLRAAGAEADAQLRAGAGRPRRRPNPSPKRGRSPMPSARAGCSSRSTRTGAARAGWSSRPVPTAPPSTRRSTGWGSPTASARCSRSCAEGRTNRQIAEALFISAKTASVHVSNILTKLDVANRGEAAAVARRLGLD